MDDNKEMNAVNDTAGNDLKGYIFEIQRMSTEDGSGIRTTVFFKECPLRCVWCHNPESIGKKPSIQWFGTKCIGCETCVDTCPEKALELDELGIHIDRDKCTACGVCVEECPSSALRKLGEYWSLEDLIKEVAKDRSYYESSGGGITASGGEAALQSGFVSAFFQRCKDLGFHTALDMCGILPESNYEPLLLYTDLFLYDLKEINSTKHKQFTAVPNERILKNIVWLKDRIAAVNPGAEIWVRTPVIPGHTATEENIRGIGEFIINNLGDSVSRWDLLSYNNLAQDKYKRMDLTYPCKGLKLLTNEEMDRFLAIAKATGVKNVQWSGLTKVSDNITEIAPKRNNLLQRNTC